VTRIRATWDDHDHGENDAGAAYPFKEISRQLFLAFSGVARDSPGRERDGVVPRRGHRPARTAGEAGYPAFNVTSSPLNLSEQMFRITERNRHRVAVLDRGDNFDLIEIDWERRDPPLRFKIIDEDAKS
jgi:hypothetical protein